MNEIICPNCKKAFKVDEAGFAAILKQVRDHQFEEELQSRLKLAEKERESAIKLTEANVKNSFQEQFAKKETEIIILKAKIDKVEVEKQLAVNEAIQKIEKERLQRMERDAHWDNHYAEIINGIRNRKAANLKINNSHDLQSRFFDNRWRNYRSEFRNFNPKKIS